MIRQSLWGAIFSYIFFTSCSESDDKVTLPSISVNSIEITEGDIDKTFQLAINLSAPVDFEVSFSVRTDVRSANEKDFKQIDKRLSIPPGSTSVPLELTIFGDRFFEEDERFGVIIYDASNATIANNVAVVTILNDDTHQLIIPETGFVSPDSYDGMTMVWGDNFDTIDETNWSFDIGTGCDQGICGWGNDELQSYAKENASIVDGNLVIEARIGSGSIYTSSKLLTKGKRSFKFGRIDIRAAMPKGQGMWPGIWMLGDNIDEVGWPACGEIDIMEMVGGGEKDSETHGTVHWESNTGYANYGGSKKIEGSKLSENFHVYSIVWDEEKIVWLIDNEEYHVIDTTPGHLSEFRDEFYLILNVAVGGNWPGPPDNSTLFPQWMIVDYIKYFKRE